jgi:hypothetical protein
LRTAPSYAGDDRKISGLPGDPRSVREREV